VVHVQGLPELYRDTRIPSVLTVHGITYKDAIYRDSWIGKPISWILRASFMESLRNYRDVITISPYVRNELSERADTRYCDIPNPIEDCFFQVDRRPDPKTVLYVGMLSRRKNIVGLLEGLSRALEQLPGIHLRLAGPWYGDYEQIVHETIARNALSEAVTLLGSLTREQLVDEFARCSCMILPSFQETAPVAIEEAMASGVPVLASKVGGVEWMIDHERTGFMFAPNRSDEMGRLLARVLSTRDLCAATEWEEQLENGRTQTIDGTQWQRGRFRSTKRQ
jgi:glycosyltransferase involved in cell wall biosynthesis